MNFNSFEFIPFLIIMVFGSYLIPFRYRWLWLLLGSYYFYMEHEPLLVLLLITSTLVDYFCALRMVSVKEKYKKSLLFLSIGVNVGMLFFFKYASFFETSFGSVLRFFNLEVTGEVQKGGYNLGQLLLPIGISFYTFQTMSYTIDVYRGKIKPEKHLGYFALFVSFFPQLVAGPIERAGNLLPQFRKQIIPKIPQIKRGLIMIAWGFFLKVVVADRLGIYVDEVYTDPELYKGLPLIIAAGFFALQLYYDFSAYTSIAIGTARLMGYDLMQNFNKPLFATSSADFWNRWHISFMQWLRDYLFVPMGGLIVRRPVLIRNVLIIFFIVGLWHGANWTFVIWGLLSALLLILETGTSRWRKRLFRRLGISRELQAMGGWAVTMTYLCGSLIFFRSPSVEIAFVYIKNLTRIQNLHINILGNYFELGLSLVLILLVQAIHYAKGNDRIYELVENKSQLRKMAIYGTYILAIALFAINRQHSFIYFQF
ncbi:MBOAT family O-acyltransferase [Muriicola soli]|uniref:MBOAT family protein n=1 Tax=Muriicola soli TaxID=2507538 RepID=A0A411E838_9FLAO|nr:MBOAT family O-acyltransferase [Muriicola soli]QBA63876.1 MBOAT family protein [Muriicola soli]